MEEPLLTHEYTPLGEQHPEQQASLLSYIFFSWLTPLIKQGYKRPLESRNLYPLQAMDAVDPLYTRFSSAYQEMGSLWRSFWQIEQSRFIAAGVCKFFSDTIGFIGPLSLNLLVTHFQDPDSRPFVDWFGSYYPHAICVLLFLSTTASSLLIQMHHHLVIRAGLHVRAVTMSMVYRKMVHLSDGEKQRQTSGKITNLMSTDAQRLNDFCWMVHYLWAAPIQIIIALSLLDLFLGPIGFTSLGIMFIILLLQAKLFGMIVKVTRATLLATDSRVDLINEVLLGIRVIKYYAWERSFQHEIGSRREVELQLVKRRAYLVGINTAILLGSPVLVALSIFYFYSLVSEQSISASTAFTALSLFNILRLPVMVLPRTIQLFVAARMSIHRLHDFLQAPEIHTQTQDPQLQPGSLHLEQATFPLETGPSLVVHRLTILPGELVLCFGKVGAGKSTLVRALIGELPPSGGSLRQRGTISYAAQTPWILNQTVRDNILFGRRFDAERYAACVQACGLQQDLDALAAGDQTEIGERGINVSGGQKQRISIARCIYAEEDMYILDDPLSALDSHVGQHVFQQCILHRLATKTRVVSTHHLQYATHADRILVLGSGDTLTIEEMGTFDALMQQQGLFYRMYSESQALGQLEEAGPPDNTSTAKETGDGALMEVEGQETGSVRWSHYVSYLRAWGFGLFAVYIGINMVSRGLTIGSDYWLAFWSSNKLHKPTLFYLRIYAIVSIASIVVILASTLLLALLGVRASRRIHRSMLTSILRAPASFFDTTPMGRVMNRFSRDMDTIDTRLPGTLGSYIMQLIQFISILALIVSLTYTFAVALVPILVAFFLFQAFYRRTSRELKRIDSVSKSPIFAHFAETLGGLATIRVFRSTDAFVHESDIRIDENNKAYLLSNLVNRWLGVRLDIMGAAFQLLLGLSIVLFSSDLSPGLIGLILSYALSLTSGLNWIIRMSVDSEIQMNAVERTSEYAAILPEDNSALVASEPADSWPQHGTITFERVCSRYRPELDLVLRDVSFTIHGGEKIGVCGRTGAGKSSLMNLLFRTISCSSGRVLIDDVDIAGVPLETLRSRLSIIPQDPVLFSGSLRFNLDPFDAYPDEQLWAILEQVQLKDELVKQDGLKTRVHEGGSNFSVGQRQLVCLARALLRNAKVLVMDECTASIDLQTDAVIQHMIREQLTERTVLTIAHRIDTILDYDRILVLDHGRIAEFGAPSVLIQNPTSFLASLGTTQSL